MKFSMPLLLVAALSAISVSAQEETGERAPASASPPAAKPLSQYTADEVLRLVRYSYTLYNRDFTGVLRMGLAKKVPFLMSLKPESIRFIFDDPAQVILLDTRNQKFALYEGVGGKELQAVSPSKYAQPIRGTDVTYDDLSMRFLYWPNAQIVGHDKLKQRECWIVRVLAPRGDAGAYATVDIWIDKGSGGMMKMIGFNSQGRPIRRFEVLHGKKFGDIWMVDEMRIETISPAAGGQVKSSTRMQIKTAVE
ncbi:MAG: outer membrane lipoprotein-sorting protein [Verrucomicrobiales bacterium]|nr:outer membrane lipoprotein-sorting protein [Verrucomicrobiales bacterium]